MIRHYLASALRNFRRRPLNTGIKLMALALGLTCLLTAHMIGDYLAQADRNWVKASRTYIVAQEAARPGGGWDGYFQTSSPPVAKHLRADVPELETVARISMMSAAAGLEGGEARWQVMGADPQILDVFDLDLVAGEFALDRPNALLINDEVAREAFGGISAAIGQTMVFENGGAAQVAGVFRTIQRPSHLSAAGGIEVRALTAMETFDVAFAGPGGQRPSEVDSFQTSVFLTYAVLPADGSLSAAAFARRLEGFAERRVPPNMLAVRFQAIPAHSVTRVRFNQGMGTVIGVSGVPALYLLGLLTLAIGCVNFANLSAAEAANRAKEIGLRKTLGANRRQVALQMLVESGLLAAAALILVQPLSAMLAPALASQFNIELTPPSLARVDYWGGVAAIAAGVAVAAGIYPALILAGLRPAFAIRMGGLRGGASLVRTVLVSTQFAAAGFLLVLVTVMAAQSSGLRQTVLDPDRNPVATLTLPPQVFTGLPPDRLPERLEDIRQRILASPAVSEATFGPLQPFAIYVGQSADYAPSLAPGAPRIPAQTRAVYFDYFSMLETPLLAGRTFSRERDETRSILIDAGTAAQLGLSPQEAVGQSLYRVAASNMQAGGQDAGPGELTIIGVVEREPLELRALGPANYLYLMRPMQGAAYFKISGENIERGLADIRSAWGEIFPGERADPRFLDESFDAVYRNFTIINTVFLALSGIAVAIAAMGLFGLASFVVQRRTREIGVRKTLGATTGGVMGRLLWDFAKPVVVANLIAWPFAFVAARIYLNLFVTRIDLTPLPFLVALVATLLIAGAAVGGQAWRAARVKPANVLKYE